MKVVLANADRPTIEVVYPKMSPNTPSMFEAVLVLPTNGTLIVVKLVIPWNAPTPILVTVFGMVIDVMPVMFRKEDEPIVCKVFGKVIEVILVNPSNALLPILVKVLFAAKVTLVRLILPLKAKLPILVTVFGIVIEVRPVFWKALLPILVTVFGIVIEVMPVFANVDEFIVMRLMSAAKVTLARLVLPLKALLPILVTVFGIVIEVRPVMPWKA